MNKELARRGKPDFLIALAGFAICVLLAIDRKSVV